MVINITAFIQINDIVNLLFLWASLKYLILNFTIKKSTSIIKKNNFPKTFIFVLYRM